MAVYRLAYNGDVAAGQNWLFFKARAKRPYLDSYGSSEQRGKTAKPSCNAARQGCVSQVGCLAALLARPRMNLRYGALRRPARTALTTAHFERDDITIICETVH